MVGTPMSPSARRAAAEQHGGEVGEHLVGEAGGDERAGERGPALDEDALDAALVQVGEHGVEVVGGEERADAAGAGGPRHPRGTSRVADHDGDRLRGEQLAVVAARGERGVVGEHGAGADDDRVGLGAAAVHVARGPPGR